MLCRERFGGLANVAGGCSKSAVQGEEQGRSFSPCSPSQFINTLDHSHMSILP